MKVGALIKELARRRATPAALLLLILFPLYLLSPFQNSVDSQFSLLVSWRLLTAGTVDLAPAFRDPAWMEGYPRGRVEGDASIPYHVHRHGDRVLYRYPHGSSVLSVPFVWALSKAGLRPARPDGFYDKLTHEWMERWIASILTSFTGLMLFYLCLYFMPCRLAFLSALAFGLGTSLWSTAANTLWAHTWGVFLLSAALLTVVRALQRNRPPFAWWMVFLFAAMCFVRPTFFLSASALFVVLLVRFPRAWVRYILPCLVFAAALLAFQRHFDLSLISSQHTAGFHQGFSLKDGLSRLAVHLLSPSRGLLITSPAVVIALWWLARGGRAALRHPLAIAGLSVISLHLVLLSIWSFVGGHCYGSRLTVCVVPWFLVLGAVGWSSAQGLPCPRWHKAIMGVLVLFGVFVHARGSFSMQPMAWNYYPPKSTEHPLDYMSWSYPQWLVGWIDEPPSALAPRIRSGTGVVFPLQGAEQEHLFGSGWGDIEQVCRWTCHEKAYLYFSLVGKGPWTLYLYGAPFVHAPVVPSQRMIVRLNGDVIDTLTFTNDALRVIKMGLPEKSLRERNALTLITPDATRPMDVGLSADDRDLGFRLHQLYFARGPLKSGPPPAKPEIR